MAATALRYASTFPTVPPLAVVPMLCDSANVLEGAALVVGAEDNSVALPSAGETPGFVGLALFAGPATTGATVYVVTGGFFPAIASGSITRGDRVVIADNTGKVKSVASTTTNGASIVGRAMESATNGQRVNIRISSPSEGVVTPSLLVVPMVAGTGGVTANCAVTQDTTTDDQVVLPAGADPVSGILGVSLNTAIATATAFVVIGGLAQGKASGNITRGQFVAVAGADGRLKSWAPVAGTNSVIVGVARASASNNGLFDMLVAVSLGQG